MRYFFTLLVSLLCYSVPGNGQEDLALQGQLDYPEELNDVWGYVDENGNEYALVGQKNGGVSVVDVTAPASLTEVFSVSAPNTNWRDIKTWEDHAYVTSENHGNYALMIIDLTPLPGGTPSVSYYRPSHWGAAHNLYIDQQGAAYVFGPDTGKGGVLMLDLTQDPKAPVELGFFDKWYAHDGMVRNDTLYTAHINNGFFSIVDVSDKAAPEILGTHTTPNGTTHNLWISDNGKELYATDEKQGAFITAYDIRNPSNIEELDRVRNGEDVVPHNTHFFNDFLITAYYRDGVIVHDVSRPGNMLRTGYFDTNDTLAGFGLDGCWGVYPWLPSGNLLATDVLTGLFV